MDVRYRIDRAQLDALKQTLIAERRLRDEQRLQDYQQRLQRAGQRFLLSPAPLLIGLAGAWCYLDARPLEFALAAAIVTALYLLFWRRWLGKRLLPPLIRLAQRRAQAAAPRRLDRLARIHGWGLEQTLRRLAGDYRLHIGDATLTLRTPAGKSIQLPWDTLSRLAPKAGFQRLATGPHAKLCYLIPQTSSLMDETQYSAGITQLLERITPRQ